jgi:hypothetical protein
VKRHDKLLNLATKYVDVHAGNRNYYTPPAHMPSPVYFELQNFTYRRYVPWYYDKETVRDTWNRTIQGYLVQGTFTENPKEHVVHIPNADSKMC